MEQKLVRMKELVAILSEAAKERDWYGIIRKSNPKGRI